MSLLVNFYTFGKRTETDITQMRSGANGYLVEKNGKNEIRTIGRMK